MIGTHEEIDNNQNLISSGFFYQIFTALLYLRDCNLWRFENFGISENFRISENFELIDSDPWQSIIAYLLSKN